MYVKYADLSKPVVISLKQKIDHLYYYVHFDIGFYRAYSKSDLYKYMSRRGVDTFLADVVYLNPITGGGVSEHPIIGGDAILHHPGYLSNYKC